MAKKTKTKKAVAVTVKKSKRSTEKGEAPYYAVAPVMGLVAKEFHVLLLYAWNDFSSYEIPAWGLARKLLQEYSDRYGSYVVPGQDLVGVATKVKQISKMSPDDYLRAMLRLRIIVPIHY